MKPVGPLSAALRMAEKMSEEATQHPMRLVEVSRTLFDDTIVRPLRDAARVAAPSDGLRLAGPCHECGGVGPVLILQSDTDPGDMGEPRILYDIGDDHETVVIVPSFSLWKEAEHVCDY